jgi:hypothetical protein
MSKMFKIFPQNIHKANDKSLPKKRSRDKSEAFRDAALRVEAIVKDRGCTIKTAAIEVSQDMGISCESLRNQYQFHLENAKAQL